MRHSRSVAVVVSRSQGRNAVFVDARKSFFWEYLALISALGLRLGPKAPLVGIKWWGGAVTFASFFSLPDWVYFDPSMLVYILQKSRGGQKEAKLIQTSQSLSLRLTYENVLQSFVEALPSSKCKKSPI